jgi:hypothetical protein
LDEEDGSDSDGGDVYYQAEEGDEESDTPLIPA